MYCEFEDTNTFFNDKPVYRCIYCNIKLLLDDPKNAKILCFSKRDELNRLVLGKENTDYVDGITSLDQLKKVATKKAFDEYKDMQPSASGNLVEMIQSIKDKKLSGNMCSEEQINERLKICSGCEYYKDNSCMLCGCVVVRDANYSNKLAHKDQSCPIMKWQEITD